MSLKNSEGIGAKSAVVSQSTMKFASDSPQFSYVELTLNNMNSI
ncbi:hypothetical protein LEP1GSC072_4332 [Leptospira noguchii str. Bonito]|nr:hypothetical protein LEP1GSC072_4332 [Leptospira noguchii str. Bonito]